MCSSLVVTVLWENGWLVAARWGDGIQGVEKIHELHFFFFFLFGGCRIKLFYISFCVGGTGAEVPRLVICCAFGSQN